MPKPNEAEPASVSEGIHIYTVDGKVQVRLGSEGLPLGCEEDCGTSWSDEYFHGNCTKEVELMGIILKGVGCEAFNRWLSTIGSDGLIQKIRQGSHAKKGKMIQQPTPTRDELEECGA